MSIWFLLWLLLSAVLLYFLGWTVYILYRQKRSWQAFAKKHKLRYRSGSLFSSPEVSGEIRGYSIHLFTGEHLSKDLRRSRRLVAVEIKLKSRMDFSAGVASGNMVEVLSSLENQKEFRPDMPEWQESYMVSADKPDMFRAYLSGPRLRALLNLMKIKNAWLILVFKDDISLLRFDTPDAIDSIKKMEALIKRMVEAAKTLELETGERARLKSAGKKADSGITVDESALDVSGLELEEDSKEDKNKDRKGEEQG